MISVHVWVIYPYSVICLSTVPTQFTYIPLWCSLTPRVVYYRVWVVDRPPDWPDEPQRLGCVCMLPTCLEPGSAFRQPRFAPFSEAIERLNAELKYSPLPGRYRPPRLAWLTQMLFSLRYEATRRRNEVSEGSGPVIKFNNIIRLCVFQVGYWMWRRRISRFRIGRVLSTRMTCFGGGEERSVLTTWNTHGFTSNTDHHSTRN